MLSILDNEGVGTIQNDDAATLSIGDYSANEGDGGTTNFTLDVTMSNPVAVDVYVLYSTVDGSALAAGDSDYTAASSQQAMIAAGSTSTTITIGVAGDTKVEPNEDFTVQISEDGACHFTLFQRM